MFVFQFDQNLDAYGDISNTNRIRFDDIWLNCLSTSMLYATIYCQWSSIQGA